MKKRMTSIIFFTMVLFSIVTMGCELGGSSKPESVPPDTDPPPDSGSVEIRQNDVLINRGSIFDFDTIPAGERLDPVVFTITNNTEYDLFFGGSPLAKLEGGNHNEFIIDISGLPEQDRMLPSGESASFTVRFVIKSTNGEQKETQVRIEGLVLFNNDVLDDYFFIIRCTGVKYRRVFVDSDCTLKRSEYAVYLSARMRGGGGGGGGGGYSEGGTPKYGGGGGGAGTYKTFQISKPGIVNWKIAVGHGGGGGAGGKRGTPNGEPGTNGTRASIRVNGTLYTASGGKAGGGGGYGSNYAGGAGGAGDPSGTGGKMDFGGFGGTADELIEHYGSGGDGGDAMRAGAPGKDGYVDITYRYFENY
jgi:hypothetical protein